MPQHVERPGDGRKSVARLGRSEALELATLLEFRHQGAAVLPKRVYAEIGINAYLQPTPSQLRTSPNGQSSSQNVSAAPFDCNYPI
jgi:hypothetical protein